MSTNRRRHRRNLKYSTLIEDLLAGRHVAQTPENREELIALVYFGWRDYADDPDLEGIVDLARAERDRWAEDE